MKRNVEKGGRENQEDNRLTCTCVYQYSVHLVAGEIDYVNEVKQGSTLE